MEKEHYLKIKEKYGRQSSWAIWQEAGNLPKSNIDNLEIFDLEINKSLLETLNPNVILVGLNISRKFDNDFANFHDGRPQSQDYKIRYAFQNTPFYGAYMTDIIKNFEDKISGNVLNYLKNNKTFEKENILKFNEELKDLKINDPIIIAFGNATHRILERNFKYKIIKIPHYSMYISKENYRDLVKL